MRDFFVGFLASLFILSVPIIGGSYAAYLNHPGSSLFGFLVTGICITWGFSLCTAGCYWAAKHP